MRNKKLMLNTVVSLILRIVTIVCGFILPRLILRTYGSDTNGLVNSLAQFLQIITFLELGIGAVLESSLYKPLAEKDDEQISKIIVSASKFFKRLAIILIGYVFVLIFIYPIIVNPGFSFIYTATLILAISVSSFAQYYFGIVDGLLLIADQRGYIRYILQVFTLLLNTISCVVLINIGQSIHVIKLVTSLFYLAMPLCQRMYVNRHYRINRKITYAFEPISQKWNGIAQHIAAVVLDGTDNLILSALSTLQNVSIYSVYHMVVYGIKQLFGSMINGIQALLGELWAKKELEELNKIFGWLEWSIHTSVTLIFGCTGVLISPFVQVYTYGIADANYNQPLFAILITIANAAHCLRYPYNLMILAAGHYKQTQRNYIVAAVLNVITSVVTVEKWGLIGVAIGTLIAMMYQTIWMAIYESKHLLKWSIVNFLKQITVDIITIILAGIISLSFNMTNNDYNSWLILALKTGLVWLTVILMINTIVYTDKIIVLYRIIQKRCRRILN